MRTLPRWTGRPSSCSAAASWCSTCSTGVICSKTNNFAHLLCYKVYICISCFNYYNNKLIFLLNFGSSIPIWFYFRIEKFCFLQYMWQTRFDWSSYTAVQLNFIPVSVLLYHISWCQPGQSRGMDNKLILTRNIAWLNQISQSQGSNNEKILTHTEIELKTVAVPWTVAVKIMCCLCDKTKITLKWQVVFT